MIADNKNNNSEQGSFLRAAVLNAKHNSAGARMGEYAGFNLPIHYGSAVCETKAVRNVAGLFDVSHMGRFELKGDEVLPCLQNLMTNDISLMSDGAGLYTLMCNPDGGVIDDLIIFRRSANSFALVVNASNLEKDRTWIVSHLPDGVELTDRTQESVLLALQGPLAAVILAAVGGGEAVKLRRFHLAKDSIAGVDAEVARTGYTGEDGFEISCGIDDAEQLWNGLLAGGREAGLTPCGLASRDVLRVEAGLPLYGHEISEQISPAESGLMRWVKLSKAPFIGHEAITRSIERGIKNVLSGIRMGGRTVPRQGYSVGTKAGEGIVTSGTFSPSLGCGIALAYIPCGMQLGSIVDVAGHAGNSQGELCQLPFVTKLK